MGPNESRLHSLPLPSLPSSASASAPSLSGGTPRLDSGSATTRGKIKIDNRKLWKSSMTKAQNAQSSTCAGSPRCSLTLFWLRLPLRLRRLSCLLESKLLPLALPFSLLSLPPRAPPPHNEPAADGHAATEHNFPEPVGGQHRRSHVPGRAHGRWSTRSRVGCWWRQCRHCRRCWAWCGNTGNRAIRHDSSSPGVSPTLQRH